MLAKRLVAVVGLLAFAATAHATVLCRRKSGAVVARADQCRAKETPIDPASLGLVGPTGPTGSTGPTGAVSEYVRADVTLRGTYDVSGIAADVGDYATDGVSFGQTLDRTLPSEIGPWPLPPIVQFLGRDDPGTPECPGTADVPVASPGYLCIYEKGRQNRGGISICRTSLLNLVDHEEACPGADPFGFSIELVAAGAGRFRSYGVWAARGL